MSGGDQSAMADRDALSVLMFSNWFPPALSGSAFYTSSLSAALAGRGHRVTVVTLDFGESGNDGVGEGVSVRRLKPLRLPRLRLFFNAKNMALTSTPANARAFGRIVDEARPDVIHHVNHIFDSTWLTTWTARARGIPIVGSITTPIQHENPAMQRLMSLADKLLLGLPGVSRWDGIVSLDGSAHRYVGDAYGAATMARSVVIPFGVRLDAMKLYLEDPLPRSEVPQVLFVGHIHPFRNPTKLVRAMAIVRRSVPDARLVLCGRVDIEEPRQAAAELGLGEDAVQFRGSVPHPEVVRLMKTSHCFASWSTGPYPGLGTAQMETMLCKTPVVNDLPEDLFGHRRLVDGDNITIVDSHDPESIARKLVPLLSDPEHNARIGAAGQRFVLEHLGWDGIAADVEAVYRRVGAGRGR